MELKTRIYQKERAIGIGFLFKESIRDIYGSHFLAKQLAVRDIKAQYRQSYLGIFWAFITPLTTAFVWVFLNLSGTIKLTDTGIPYPVYAFSGVLFWSILKESINTPSISTRGAMGMMGKINFPKEALIVSGIYKLMFNSAIKILLLLVFLLLFGVGFHFSILLFPIALLGCILLGTTIGLFITPLSMLYKDISKIVSLGLSLMMYVTPVVYAIPAKGVLKKVMEWNPFTPFIFTARDWIVGSPPQYLHYFIGIVGVCIPIFFLGLVFYRVSIPIIVERIGA